MPMYRRKTGKYGTYYKKSKKNIGYRRAGNKALRLAKYAVKMMNVEFKNVDTSFSSSVDSSGTIQNIMSISQGDSNSQRDGRSVKFVSIALKGRMEINTSAVTTNVRVLLVRQLNMNQTLPTVLDVLQTSTINSLRNLDNTDNVKVLYDKRWNLDPNSYNQKLFSINRKLNIRPQYAIGNTGGGLTALERNGIYLLLLTSEAANTPTIAFESRLRFIDN